MNPVVWANGHLQRSDAAIISATDHGLTVGDGVFETMLVTDRMPFALTRHLARLHYSAERMSLTGLDDALVREAIDTVIDSGGDAINRLRVTVTSGPGPMSSVRGDGPLSVVVVGVHGPRPRECRVVRVPWVRNERSPLAGVKSTSYGENAVMAQYARERGADEVLMANTYGNLCEGTASNVFVERDDEILTPSLASGCLAGVTRGLALEWGSRAGLPVRVAVPGELGMSVLDQAVDGRAHLAVTSSTRGVQHVASLDGRVLRPGALLRRLSAVYELNAERDPDPVLPRPA